MGGISVVRISGKNMRSLANIILDFIPQDRYAHRCSFYDKNHEVIDCGIALFFPAPNSYTGEDVLELQGHGSPVVMNLLLSACLQAGARLAQPGEFTLRAYLNSKLDLVQAESVADIISATSSQAVRSSLRSLQGDFSLVIHSLVDSITELRMRIEAVLNFPEDDVGALSSGVLINQVENIVSQLDKVLEHSNQGRILREGATVVLVGQPNVGKSSLMNVLSGDDVSIVTNIPGTTRDAIRETIQIEGVPLHLIDTAGLRDSSDIIENSGIVRTRAAINKADIILLLIDVNSERDDADHIILESLPTELPLITVYNKIDLLPGAPTTPDNNGNGLSIYLSAKSGVGVPLLRTKLLETIGWHSSNSGEGLFVARQRHLQALTKAKDFLGNAKILASKETSLELLAEELTLSQSALASITGEFSADDLLGEIFSKFCIGK